MRSWWLLVVVLALAGSGCVSNRYGAISKEVGDRMMSQRRAEILAEPKGDYYIGRRYVLPQMKFWGYLREPGAAWETAKIVLMDESVTRVPDRLAEEGEGLNWQYDHNYEYVIRGEYTGKTGYDPISNFQIPIFRPRSFELKKRDGGFLYLPGERPKKGQLPSRPR